MGLMDKVKSQATQLAEKAQQAAGQGQAKLDATLAKRKADGMLLELGGLTYLARTGRGSSEGEGRVAALTAQLQAHEAEHGALRVTSADANPAAAAGAAAPPPSSSAPVANPVASAGPLPQSQVVSSEEGGSQ